MNSRLLGLIALIAVALPSQAWAWKTVHAISGGSPIHSSASPDSDVVGTVPAGKPITIGDRPTNGFYRANGGKGMTGWVGENDVDWGGNAPSGGGGESHSSRASIGSNMYAGALIGMAFASGGSKLEFGLDGGYKFSPEWGLGLYLTYSSSSSEAATGLGSTISASASSIIIAPEINYFLQGELKGLHLGGKIGLNMVSSSVNGGASESSSNLVFGAAAGYDYPVSTNITIGGEANFLIVSSSGSSSTSGSTTTTSSGSTSVFNILAVAKYWF